MSNVELDALNGFSIKYGIYKAHINIAASYVSTK